MSTNASVLVNANYLVLDNTVNPGSYIVNRIRSLSFGALVAFYDAFFQAATIPATVVLPSILIQVAMVVNLSTLYTVTVQFIPNGGSLETLLLQPSPNQGQPGGAFFYMNPTSVGNVGGLSALSLLASGNNASCEVLVAG